MKQGLVCRKQVEPLDLSEAIRESPFWPIAGVAGSGKSTLLQWAGLACSCARLDLVDEISPEQHEFLQAIGGEAPPFPLLIPLRAFNDCCVKGAKKRTSRSILEFLVEYFGEKCSVVELTPEFFLEQLKKSCLLMFDGMDEVPPDDRPYVRAAVLDFLNEHDGPGLRCLITSRFSAAYITDQMPDFRRCDVQPLSPQQRDELVHLWYRAALPDDQESAGQKADRLCNQIRTSDPRVQKLAITP